jgi:hypothetical protein
MPELAALGKMKQLAGQFTKGLPGGAHFRQTLYHSHSAAEILDNIEIYFNTIQSDENSLVDTGMPLDEVSVIAQAV